MPASVSNAQLLVLQSGLRGMSWCMLDGMATPHLGMGFPAEPMQEVTLPTGSNYHVQIGLLRCIARLAFRLSISCGG